MKIKTETKIGIVGVLTIGILIWGVNFLKGKNLFEKQNTYHAKYDNINGLLPTSCVYKRNESGESKQYPIYGRTNDKIPGFV